MVKVETSNSYVLVKDSKPSSDDSDDVDGGDNADANGVGDTTEARLLRENNTFFLECTETKDNLELGVQSILNKYVYPADTDGVSVQELAASLMYSKKQIHDALEKIKAFPIPSVDGRCRYGTLSEEMEREIWFIIVSVLAEWAGGSDYAGKGVDLEEMVKEVLKRNDGGDDSLEEGVVRHCLEKCSSDVTNGCAKLSVDYVSSMILLGSCSIHNYYDLDSWMTDSCMLT